MTRMSGNDKSLSADFGDSLQLTNCILDSGAKFHMTPNISDYIPDSLEDTNNKLKFQMEIMSR